MRRLITTVYVCWIGLLVSGCSSQPATVETTAKATAEGKVYMVIFASQTEPSRPQTAHTFATFVKATDAAGADQKSLWESHTISWLPANGNVVLVRLAPEPGKNFTLEESLKWAKEMNARVAAWGPFEIKQELFDSALQQIERLNSGKIAYKAIDSSFRGGTVVNCIHAVSDIATENGLLTTGTAYGESASALVARHLKRWIVNTEAAYPEIMDRLGLPKDEVRFQKLEKTERSTS